MELRKRQHLYKLTKRETETLSLLAKGWTNQQIANRLCLSTRTVKFHTGNIYSKLGLKSRSQAIVWVWHHSETQSSVKD
jgi:DNA-binding NarL/FixJ family response regulator